MSGRQYLIKTTTKAGSKSIVSNTYMIDIAKDSLAHNESFICDLIEKEKKKLKTEDPKIVNHKNPDEKAIKIDKEDDV